MPLIYQFWRIVPLSIIFYSESGKLRPSPGRFIEHVEKFSSTVYTANGRNMKIIVNSLIRERALQRHKRRMTNIAENKARELVSMFMSVALALKRKCRARHSGETMFVIRKFTNREQKEGRTLICRATGVGLCVFRVYITSLPINLELFFFYTKLDDKQIYMAQKQLN